MNELRVDGDSLMKLLSELAAHGRSPSGGWTRPALSEADAAARRIVIARLAALGLEIRHDEVGNLRARRPGSDGAAAPVWTGSHLDSVPSGGYLDGPLGVAGAVCALEALARAKVKTRRAIEVVVFVGEEGSRFPRGTIGSAAVSGELSAVEVLALRDAEGVSFADALAAYRDPGAAIPARVAPGEVHAFVELHVEQGGVLEANGAQIGAVTAIAGLVQRAVTFTGDANHAGATPMHLRRDALLAAAEWALALERAAREVGGGAVATVGKLEVFPGGKNIIPGRVEAICDLRAPDAAHLDAVDARAVAALQHGAARRVAVSERRLQRVEPGAMDERVIAAVERAAAQVGLRSHRMVSGAIHDALHMAEVTASSMIFVPSVGGRSHCPEEETRPEHLTAGATVLAHLLLGLAG
ncbi:MAG: Zn-dependent hydrolase [Myxococcales bacterium]|nr:Zn-dependent hydrolase [Myxococcales bacterium]